MIKLMTTAAVLMALATPALADTSIPQQFLGTWCEVDHDTSGARYRRGNCGMKVMPQEYSGPNGRCELLAISQSRKGNYLVVFHCYIKGEPEEGATISYWWTMNQGQLVKLVNRQHAGDRPFDM